MISRHGMSPLVVTQDTPGPMCRTVRDTALMFDAMVGFDSKDPFTTANIIGGPPKEGSYAATLSSARASDLRIGVVNELFGPDSDSEMSPVNSCVRTALSQLKNEGAKVIDISIPNLRTYFRSTFLYQTRSQSDLNNFFASTPNVSHLSVKSIYNEKAFHPALDLFSLIAQGPANPHDDPDFAKKLLAQDEFRRVVLSIMAENNVNVLAFPDCKIAAPKTEDMLRGRWGIYEFPTNTVLASQAVLPAVSVPVGVTGGSSEEGKGEGGGLPVGMELVGFPYKEQLLLEAAAVVERVVRGRSAPRLD
jgi:amidase